MSDTEAFKRQAGVHAADLVESGMVVGLGTGSTAIHATRHIATRLRDGTLRDIRAIATSRGVHEEALRLGIPMIDEALPEAVDLTIDGADEIDPALNLIKGGGGALLREKIVAQASRREIIVADEQKCSPLLGTRFPLPIEVLAFGWQSQARFLEALGARVVLRRDGRGEPARTDQDNLLLDAHFGPIDDAPSLAARLGDRAGIVAHGLFLGLAQEAIITGPGGIRHLRRPSPGG